MATRIVQTADGSSSVFVEDFDELYHSVHGAITESLHVFIEAALKQTTKQEINIFEMGFGTGLNFILSLINADNKKINYHTIEAYPLDINVIKQLNYPTVLKLSEAETELFFSIHNSKNEKKTANGFKVIKTLCKLWEYKSDILFDIVYFDAFGPDAQPELWTQEVFQKIYNMMNSNGILTTYCAKGAIRRNMQACGFVVERLPGPPGKREMLRAIKP